MATCCTNNQLKYQPSTFALVPLGQRKFAWNFSLERNGWAGRDVRAPRVRLGISIARNSNTPAVRAATDYAACMAAAWRYADYFMLNLGTVQTELAVRTRELGTLLEDTRARHALLAQRFGCSVALAVKFRLTPNGLEQMLELLPRLARLPEFWRRTRAGPPRW